MITFDAVTVTYDGAVAPALRDVSFEVPEGELVLAIGPTGSGKSTLLRCVNALVPRFTGGTLQGSVIVEGRDTRDHQPRDLADVVGYVPQDPQHGFVTDIVEDELAYVMESLAVPPDVMRRRVEETLDLLGIADLRARPLRNLSGGQRQRVAIGAVLTAGPRVLVLDEPTSALDPLAAEEVLASIQRLVHDVGLTVIMSEHRLERAVQYADSVLLLDGAGRVQAFASPADAMVESPLAPPVVELGRWAGWQPLPLSIRDARRVAGAIRSAAADRWPTDHGPHVTTDADSADSADHPGRGNPVITVAGASLRLGSVAALRAATLSVAPGEIVALMGRNGAGKSTLLNLLAGQTSPDAGQVHVAGRDPTGLTGSQLLHTVTLVPQEPQDLLWAESVAAECRAADEDAAVTAGATWSLFRRLRPDVPDSLHPNDLSEGTRLALVLAIMLVGDPLVLLLDEPTRGLDYGAKRELAVLLRERAAAGRAVVVATHDVELLAEVATRMVLLAEGEVVADTDAREAAVSSPLFAPQVAKILAPVPLLTAAEVATAFPEGPPTAGAGDG